MQIFVEAIKYGIIKKRFGNQYANGRIHPYGTYPVNEPNGVLKTQITGPIWHKDINHTKPQEYKPIVRYSQTNNNNFTFSKG